MTLFSFLITALSLTIIGLLALLVFGMAQAAGKYDEVSERIYRNEMEKLERSKKMMEEANTNPEYIEREQI
jgi:hypothetical protein